MDVRDAEVWGDERQSGSGSSDLKPTKSLLLKPFTDLPRRAVRFGGLNGG